MDTDADPGPTTSPCDADFDRCWNHNGRGCCLSKLMVTEPSTSTVVDLPGWPASTWDKGYTTESECLEAARNARKDKKGSGPTSKHMNSGVQVYDGASCKTRFPVPVDSPDAVDWPEGQFACASRCASEMQQDDYSVGRLWGVCQRVSQSEGPATLSMSDCTTKSCALEFGDTPEAPAPSPSTTTTTTTTWIGPQSEMEHHTQCRGEAATARTFADYGLNHGVLYSSKTKTNGDDDGDSSKQIPKQLRGTALEQCTYDHSVAFGTTCGASHVGDPVVTTVVCSDDPQDTSKAFLTGYPPQIGIDQVTASGEISGEWKPHPIQKLGRAPSGYAAPAAAGWCKAQCQGYSSETNKEGICVYTPQGISDVPYANSNDPKKDGLAIRGRIWSPGDPTNILFPDRALDCDPGVVLPGSAPASSLCVPMQVGLQECSFIEEGQQLEQALWAQGNLNYISDDRQVEWRDQFKDSLAMPCVRKRTPAPPGTPHPKGMVVSLFRGLTGTQASPPSSLPVVSDSFEALDAVSQNSQNSQNSQSPGVSGTWPLAPWSELTTGECVASAGSAGSDLSDWGCTAFSDPVSGTPATSASAAAFAHGVIMEESDTVSPPKMKKKPNGEGNVPSHQCMLPTAPVNAMVSGTNADESSATESRRFMVPCGNTGSPGAPQCFYAAPGIEQGTLVQGKAIEPPTAPSEPAGARCALATPPLAALDHFDNYATAKSVWPQFAPTTPPPGYMCPAPSTYTSIQGNCMCTYTATGGTCAPGFTESPRGECSAPLVRDS